MRREDGTRLAAAAGALALGAAAAAAEKPALNAAAVDKAMDALKTLDWGQDYALVRPIDEAIAATRGDLPARKGLETRLAAVLKTDAPRDAKDFVCRKLMVIGTAESVPVLAGLLAERDLSHMARYALERIPAPEAAQAMSEALPKLSGQLKIGVIGSLGVRRDKASVAGLKSLLGDADPAVACAAATALGVIGSPEAAKALGEAPKTAHAGVTQTVADARLACAERLLAEGNKADAKAVYASLNGPDQPKSVRLAATRGLLNVAAKKD